MSLPQKHRSTPHAPRKCLTSLSTLSKQSDPFLADLESFPKTSPSECLVEQLRVVVAWSIKTFLPLYQGPRTTMIVEQKTSNKDRGSGKVSIVK